MSSFYLQVEASAVYGTAAPTLEVLVNGVVVSSATVTAQTGFGTDTFLFLLDFSSGSVPSSLSLRFNDGSPEGGRSIDFTSVRINGQLVNSAYIGASSVVNGQSSSIGTTAIEHLYGRTAPTTGNYDPPTQSGTSGNDQIEGTSNTAPDIISAGDGNDRIRGLDGDDIIFGGAGNDVIYGGTGNNVISGDDGDDQLYGEAGDDLIHGGVGNDSLLGGTGNDILNGGAGNDTLRGEDGNDILFGEDGDDRLIGGAGNDYLYGDAGNDVISGGAGNDVAYGGLGNDQILGDAGNDTLYGEGGNDQIFGGAGNDVIYGNTGNDVLNGDAGDDTIHGGNEDDTISGDAGADILNGDAGNDRIFGGSGADVINGGDGDDRLVGHSLDNASISAILRNNPGVLYNADTGNFYRYVSTALDYSSAKTAAESATLNGVAGHLVAIGSAAENTFVQSLLAGNDAWLGASDAGGEGVWRWFGGSDDGGNFSSGSTAINNYYANWAASNPNGGTAENYAVMNTNGTWSDVTAGSTHRYIIEWEGLSYSDDNAIDTISGGIGNDVIYGGGGNDILNGDDGNDRIFGNAGNDTINGGNGDDYIVDYEGANIINGGAGNDVLVSRYLPSLTVPTIDAQIQTILLANSGVEYNADTGNFYKYITTSSTWTTANTNAATNLINGVSAHLVTITSQEENDFVDEISGSANIYIGGTDSASEGVWRWTTGGGSESGAQFWQGTSSGSAQNGYYTNFSGSQPNAGNTDEDYLGMTDGGLWTDERAATTRTYVIEWEGSSLLVTPPATPAQTANIINGGNGNDTIYGGNGNDTLSGEDDNDTIYGEAGNDTIYGDAGSDIISGGTGNDTIYGGENDDIAAGDAGNDTIYGGNGNDTLYASNRIVTHLSKNFTSSTESFVYADGGFGGTDPGNDNASGTRITTDGAATASGALEVFLDGATATTETNISGSWNLTFTATETTANTELVFYYRVIHAAANDTNENAFVYASFDGVNYGTGGNNFVIRVNGGAGAVDTGWIEVTLNIGTVTAGAHTISLGGFKNSKSAADEDTTFRFDDVRLVTSVDNDNGSINTVYGEAGNDIIYGSGGTDTLIGGSGNDTIYSGSRLPITYSDIMAANPGVVYNATTNSFYKFVNTSTTWVTANTAAQAATINGVAGHLAVVTSATENSYLDALAGTSAIWLAGTDQTTEGTWVWSAPGSPDNGQAFWVGGSAGSAQNGYYTNWRSSDPANSSATDDYMRMRDGGQWDDRTSTQTARYVIEWEGTNILTSTPTTNYLNGGDGLDTIYGSNGTDIFIFEAASAFNNVDIINGFRASDGDAIDISDVISGYDPLTDSIADFVMISDGTATDSYMAVIKNYDSMLYYRLGETSGTTAADSMGVLNGTYINTPTLNVADFNGGLTNNAVDLNGSSQYIRVTDSGVFDLSEATFVAWFRSDTNSATQQIVLSKDGTTGGQFNIGVTTNDGDIVGMLQNGGGAAVNFDINQSVALNTWYMLTISFSTVTGVEIYLNNNSIYTNTGFTTALASNYDFIIGASNTGGNTTMAQYFNGRIDEVAVYNYKLSDQSVANIYQAGIAAIDGTFANGVYVENAGNAQFGSADRIAQFAGTTSVQNAIDMLAGGNIIT